MFSLVRFGLIVGLWTTSIALMIGRTIDNADPALAPLTGWSILTAIVAAVITAWHLLIYERHRVCDIAKMAATAVLEEKQLRSVD